MSPFRSLRKIPTKIIISAVTILVLGHLILLVFYARLHKHTQHEAKRSVVVQQVMNLLHMVEATPAAQLDHAVKAMREPNITADISTDPAWELRPEAANYWSINQIFPRYSGTVKLSFLLPDRRWLNVEGFISPTQFWPVILLIVLEVIFVGTILFYIWSINRFSTPLRSFQEAAEKLGVDIKKQIELEEYEGPQIIRETAQAMNRMQERIRCLLKDRTLMLAAIAHDLRTPITRLKLRADFFKDDVQRNKMIKDLDEMEEMISEVLAFARADDSDEAKIKLDLNALLLSLCDDMSDVGYAVTYGSGFSRLPYLGRSSALRRAFTNLVQNAINYGKCAHVYLRSAPGGRHRVIIEDEGPGISEKELEKVFSPFYRCDVSRSKNVAGTGLGLAVTEGIIRSHGGEIQLQNRPEGGLRVTVIL
jgi:signal transduction histidine kinase